MGCGASGLSDVRNDNKCDNLETRSRSPRHMKEVGGTKQRGQRSETEVALDLKEKLDMLVARLVLEEEQDLLFGAFGGNSVNGFASRASKTAANSLSTKEINTHSSVLTIETPFEKDVLSPLSATSKGCKCNEESWTEKLLKQECAMCLEEFSYGDSLRILFCSHAFHKDCIDEWFTRSRTCPFCLQDITTLPRPEDLPESKTTLPYSPFQAPLPISLEAESPLKLL